MTINHSALFNNGEYYLSLHTGSITDMAGNSLALWSGSLKVDSIPPAAKIITPIRNVVNVNANQVIKINLQWTIKAGNMDFELKTSSGKEVKFT